MYTDKYAAMRDQARMRLGQAMSDYGDAGNDVYAANQRAADLQQYQQQTDTGSPMLKGAMAGSAFGPWGALIGGGIGFLSGASDSVGARRKAGEKHALGAALDPFRAAKSALHSPYLMPAASAVGTMYAGAKSRDEANPYGAPAPSGGMNPGFDPNAVTMDEATSGSNPFQLSGSGKNPYEDEAWKLAMRGRK